MSWNARLILAASMMVAGCAAGAREPAQPVVQDKAPARLQPFAFGQVQLLPGHLRDAFETNARYLRSLEPDRYLWTFRKNAGLPAPGEPYGGWEEPNCELRGHSIGHYLSACARVVAQTGDPVLKRNADYTVAELAKCQAKLGNGYLSAFPEEFFDRVERLQRVWAPYYTIHKIMLGLWEMHAYAGNRQALDVLRGMADYFKARCDRLNDEQMQQMLRNEFGGMQEVLLNLYASTGQAKYLELAQRFVKKSFVDPLGQGRDNLAGLHANTHLPQISGQARAYELTGDPACRKVVESFWSILVNAHSYATGGSSVGEHWGPPNKLANTLAATNQEFCTSYNFQKLCRYLLRWTGDVRYADMIERNFYNGILVSQHPQTGMLIYFLPFKTGMHKEHGSPFQTFTCCYGTGIQEYASLAQDVFYHDQDTFFVNLFASAEVSWQSPSGLVHLTQQSEFPDQHATRITVQGAKPARFRLAIRVPEWARKGLAIRVNAQPVKENISSRPGSWLTLERTWQSGDTVDVQIPLSLATVPMNDDPTLCAIRYGPMVLAGIVDALEVHRGFPAPVFTGDPARVEEWLQPVQGKPLTFRTTGQPVDLTFLPIHRVVSERYGLYWRFVQPGSAELAKFTAAVERFRQRRGRIVDSVAIGDAESERSHGFEGKNTQSGQHAAGIWRHALEGGFFSYRMTVDPQSANSLAVTYWGSDSGRRTFDILVDGQRIATQSINRNAPDELFEVEYPIPAELTRNRQSVTVRFQPAGPGQVAGGVFGLAVLRADMPQSVPAASDYPIQAVPFTDVAVDDEFWTPRLQTNRKISIPHAFRLCEETGRIDNFAIAGKLKQGSFRGIYFNDSDVFKIIEGASYVLATQPDPKLDSYLDDLIAKIAAAQEPDGYLYTARTLCGPDYMPPGGKERWSDMAAGHELYNVGHLYEAAVAHHQATGKRNLLEVAIKNADLVCSVFGPGKRSSPCGHQEIEIGLVKLYRLTGNRKYLDMARSFLEMRGRPVGRSLYGIYAQDHKPVSEQTEAVGHAVRAGYMYTAMADVAALAGEAGYLTALSRIWENVVGRKLYLTGGIGARGGGEAFGEDYELPNRTAYAETCAAIANALWNHRMFLMTGQGKFVDVLERVIYNGFLAGISMEGDRFFYTNPLESHGGVRRSPWFDCACCPSNVVRFVPQIPGFAYARRGSDLYVNLFISSVANVRMEPGTVRISQQTRYPWEGKVLLTVEPAASPATFTVRLRIPGWARNQPVPSDLYRNLTTPAQSPSLRVNGEPTPIQLEDGYAVIKREWKAGDRIELDLPMEVRRVVAHPNVKDDVQRVAIERGPIVFCAEGPDNQDGRVLSLVLPDNAPLQAEYRKDLFNGLVTIRGPARVAVRDKNGAPTLGQEQTMLAIPYYAWAHRKAEQMAVWLARDILRARPAPAPTIAFNSRVSASGGGPLSALNDQLEPASSIDHSNPFFHWWPRKGTAEWVQYDFAKPVKVNAVDVYWFDDTGIGECRLPKSWRLLAKVQGQWQAVSGASGYGLAKDTYNRTTFDPLEAEGLRLEVQLADNASAGIHEWRVFAADQTPPALAAPAGPQTTEASTSNLLPNGSFEQADGQRPRRWRPYTWGGQGRFEHAALGRTGSRSVMISSDQGADVAWTTTVPVEPWARYRLSGWIRTANVKVTSGRGALLNVHNLPAAATPALTGDNDWKPVQIDFDVEDQDALQVNCLFGGWGLASGTAWYDDIQLVQLSRREPPAPRIAINAAKVGQPISHYIYGQFIEHLGRCIYGGIWAEMLEDRKFFYAVGQKESPWKPIGGQDAVAMVKEGAFVGQHTPQIRLAGPDQRRGIEQAGLGLLAGKEYTGHIWLAADGNVGPVSVSLIWGDGPADRQEVQVAKVGTQFERSNLRFRSGASTDNGRIQVTANGTGALRIGTISLMPADNVQGMRADTLRLLRELNAPVYRWPGGNFVSGYNWKDGIGERDRRPPRKNPAWQGVEHNDFGIDEFITFCRLIQTEPYITVNSGLGDVQMAVEEVQYANGDANTPMGQLRAKNGQPEPYKVRWWAIGNEMYGDWQLGHMPLEKYIQKHNQFAEAMRKVDPTIKLIAVGAVGPWSQGMLRNCADHMDLISEHFYCQARPGLLAHVRLIPGEVRRIAEAHRQYRREFDSLKGKDIRIALDEWNYWYGPHVFGELGTRYFLKDGLGIAAGIHEYGRNSDIYFMANYAQTVNVIGCIKTSKTAAAFESTGLVLKLYRQHFGTKPLDTQTSGLIDALAALSDDGKILTVGVVNPTLQPLQIPLELRGLQITGTGQRWEIGGNDPMAFNDPAEPDRIRIQQQPVTGLTDRLAVGPCSVSLFRLDLK